MESNDVHTLSEWRKLTFEEKRDVKNHQWSPYDKQKGMELREEILGEFKERIKNVKNSKYIKEIEFGWAGFDVLFIWVTIKKGKKIRLPKVYDEVFPIKKVFE